MKWGKVEYGADENVHEKMTTMVTGKNRQKERESVLFLSSFSSNLCSFSIS